MGSQDPNISFKAALLETHGYSLVQPDCPVKLNQNECPFDVPQALKREILDETLSRNWGRYPDFVPTDVKEKLARHHGVMPESVLIGNGSNELIQATFMSTIGPGRGVVIAVPTFSLYALMNTVLEGDLRQVPMREDLSFDTESLISAARSPDVKLTVLCSPNNPTGSLISLTDVAAIAEAASGLVIVDEAYFEFGGQTSLGLLADHSNMIITRTFSKALGAAGLRIGYLVAHPDVAKEIEKVKLPYNVNIFSLIATRRLLDEGALVDERVSLIRSERDRVTARLAELPGVTPYTSSANFVLFRIEQSVEATFQGLITQGVLIRDVSHYPLLDQCLRVTIGTPSENDTFLQALNDVIG
jgi:histidinol-phosphate aminotransferase